MAERVVGGKMRCEIFGSTEGRIDREILRDWESLAILKLSVRFGDGGRTEEEVLGGVDFVTGLASATSLYDTMAREDRVVAGRVPGTRNENGNPCEAPWLKGQCPPRGNEYPCLENFFSSRAGRTIMADGSPRRNFHYQFHLQFFHFKCLVDGIRRCPCKEIEKTAQ